MSTYLTMKKRFPTKWTNEVFHKFLLINVKSPDVLFCHIIDGTLNPKLKATDFLSMTSTTLQVLTRATPHYNIHTSIDTIWPDTNPWTIRKKQ